MTLGTKQTCDDGGFLAKGLSHYSALRALAFGTLHAGRSLLLPPSCMIVFVYNVLPAIYSQLASRRAVCLDYWTTYPRVIRRSSATYNYKRLDLYAL